jgi:hypothetical protein
MPSFFTVPVLACLAALTLAADAVAAEPLLVPEFTPASPDEFAIAGMLGLQLQDRLLADGHIVLTEAVVQPVVGPALQSCAARAGCPSDVLPRLPARLAVVVLVGRDESGGLIGYARLFVGSDPRPTQALDLPILPGQESLFVDQVAAAVQQILAVAGPSPDAVLMAAARLISGEPLAPVAPAPVPRAPPPPRVVLREEVADGEERAGVDERPPKGTRDERPLTAILEGTDVAPRTIVGAEESLRKSGEDPRDWMFHKTPHGGRLIIDVQAGLGIGDTERAADLRATVDVDGVQTESWYQEGPYYARRPRGGLFVGYAPSAWVDFGLFAGMQYGNRVLTTGNARALADGSYQVTTNAPQSLQAVQFTLQPRVRGYVVPTGPAKPYVFTGPEFRIFDSYKLEQPPNGPLYPIPPGGVVSGWTGGGGLMIDPGPIVGFFAEGTYTRTFGLRAGPAQNGLWSQPLPPPPLPTFTTLAVVGGVQFRI